MIENGKHELSGQFELSDFMAEAETPAEGYDGEGRLLNEDWPAKAPGAPAAVEPLTPADDRLRTLAVEIHAITEHARVVLASAAIDIGKRLIEAQGLVPDGRWYEWLEANVDYSVRQAQVMMQLADRFGRGELPEVYKGLGISHMTALLAAPEEEREDLARMVQDESLSVRQLKAEIQAMKAEKAQAQMKLDAMIDQMDRARENIAQLDAEAQAQSQAIVERDRQLKDAAGAIEREREAARLAEAKASAAEASAEQLRRMRSEAEDRAAASAQRASDAVNRANQTAKDLSAARAEIARLEAEKAAGKEPEPEVVEVIPDSVRKELDDLRARLAEATAAQAPTVVQAAEGPTASDRFKWFYQNQMKPAFTTALELLREVAKEDGHAADLFATAITKGCQQLMNQLGAGGD